MPLWLKTQKNHSFRRGYLKTPRAGFEPATNRLTVDRSTAELPRNGPTNRTRRTYPSAPPPCKRLKLFAQLLAAAPRSDAAFFHASRAIGMVQFIESVGDPEGG